MGISFSILSRLFESDLNRRSRIFLQERNKIRRALDIWTISEHQKIEGLKRIAIAQGNTTEAERLKKRQEMNTKVYNEVVSGMHENSKIITYMKSNTEPISGTHFNGPKSHPMM